MMTRQLVISLWILLIPTTVLGQSNALKVEFLPENGPSKIGLSFERIVADKVGISVGFAGSAKPSDREYTSLTRVSCQYYPLLNKEPFEGILFGLTIGLDYSKFYDRGTMLNFYEIAPQIGILGGGQVRHKGLVFGLQGILARAPSISRYSIDQNNSIVDGFHQPATTLVHGIVSVGLIL